MPPPVPVACRRSGDGRSNSSANTSIQTMPQLTSPAAGRWLVVRWIRPCPSRRATATASGSISRCRASRCACSPAVAAEVVVHVSDDDEGGGHGRRLPSRPRAGYVRVRPEQAELPSPLHRRRAGAALQLPVGRGDLRLHRVPGHVQLLGDLAEGQVGRQQLQDPELGRGERHAVEAGARPSSGQPLGEVLDPRLQDPVGEQAARYCRASSTRIRAATGSPSSSDTRPSTIATCAPSQGKAAGDGSAPSRCAAPASRRAPWTSRPAGRDQAPTA